MALQRLHDAGDGGGLLADSDVDADHVFVALVDDSVDRDSRLARLAVADDQLALAAADRNHRVNGENARLHGLLDRLAGVNARRLELDGAHALRLDGALAVDRLAERVHDAAKHAFAGRNLDDAARRAHLVVFLDSRDIAQKNGADLVLFEVLGQAVNGLAVGTGELQKLACHGAPQAVNARDAVADLDDRADLAGLDAHAERVKLLAQGLVNRLCGDFSH